MNEGAIINNHWADVSGKHTYAIFMEGSEMRLFLVPTINILNFINIIQNFLVHVKILHMVKVHSQESINRSHLPLDQ
jgi:hypothetical protein